MSRFLRLGVAVVVLSLMAGGAGAAHRVAIQGKGRLAILGPKGQIEWEMPWGPIHDLHVLKNGHFLVQQGAATVAEIDPQTKQVVWSYDAAAQTDNAGRRVEVHAFQPLDGGRLLIAESGPARLIEVDRAKAVLKTIPLKVNRPNPHTDTRLVRKLDTGNYLVCHEGDGIVREYDGRSGAVVWEYDVPLFGREPKGGHGPEAFGDKCFAAVRLPSGNTLLTTGNGHGVLEVTPDKRIVWQLQQHDLPGIVLAWVTTLEVLPNGNYVIGNCHAGRGNPQLIEVDPRTKRVVWTLDQFDTFGNDVSNTQILGPERAAAR